MSIFIRDIDIENCDVIVMPDQSIAIAYKKTDGLDDSFDAIGLRTPEEAHVLRAVVNKAVDIFLRNDLKKG